ncbi:MAG: hypothetical protein C4340_00370, partial [Armatimonadota bacterium]
MTRGIEAATRGMKSQALLLDVVANNLANVNTTGFKRDGLAFADLMMKDVTLPGPNGPEVVGSIGQGAQVADEYTVADVGSLVATGNPLDVALLKPAQYFAVETPQG